LTSSSATGKLPAGFFSTEEAACDPTDARAINCAQ
jgi:hypothetical protein